MKIRLRPLSYYPSLKESVKIRKVRENDLTPLSTLFYHGYKDSVDYRDETLCMYRKEIKALLRGLYGPFLFDSSYVYLDKKKMLSASLITLYQNIPLLIYAVTLPEYKRQGIFSQLLAHSMHSLYKKGYKELYLVVTNDNYAAHYVYKKFGFQETTLEWKEIVNK
ncbi:MAG: GNAT family N-acetyltransferase [Bacillus sp. (in: firmicutes)]